MNDILSFFDDGFGFEKTPGLYSYRDSRTKKSEKTWKDYDHDGAIIQYVGKNHKENYARSLKNRFIPFSKDADEYHSGTQVTGVYSYPFSDINEAFWNQHVDKMKLRPHWRKDCDAIRDYVESLNAKIAELQKKANEYEAMLPDASVDRNLTLDGKGAR